MPIGMHHYYTEGFFIYLAISYLSGSLTRNSWLYSPQTLAHFSAQVALFECNIHEVQKLTTQQLRWLLEGLSINQKVSVKPAVKGSIS